MIIGIREVGVLPGKAKAARELMNELNPLVREITSSDVESARPIGGNPQRVGWCARYKDMAAYEAAWAKLAADQRFAAMMQKTPDIFVPGSMHEVLWQTD